jgi:hypothetical protein
MKTGLVQSLFQGKLDVVGDVHGELDALLALVDVLGYDEFGRHPAGRRLVFVGDLCDRGPDSIGVIDRVRAWIDAGRAQCVLGNHELNLLRGAHKDGNGWFFDDPEHEDHGHGRFQNCRSLSADQRSGVLDFLRSLPLVLDREDLQIVHACPDAASLSAAHTCADGNVAAFYRIQSVGVEARIAALPNRRQIDDQKAHFRTVSKNSDAQVEPLPAFAAAEAIYQNGNAVRVLTSGLEAPAETTFYSSGQWRLLSRVKWWETYCDSKAVMFGHYWRTHAGAARPVHKGVHGMFDGIADAAWLGEQHNAFCVDFSVGMRYVERARGVTTGFDGRLAAMRWPERELVFDDGRRVDTSMTIAA